jgi:hypothetical protein
MLSLFSINTHPVYLHIHVQYSEQILSLSSRIYFQQRSLFVWPFCSTDIRPEPIRRRLQFHISMSVHWLPRSWKLRWQSVAPGSGSPNRLLMLLAVTQNELYLKQQSLPFTRPPILHSWLVIIFYNDLWILQWYNNK